MRLLLVLEHLQGFLGHVAGQFQVEADTGGVLRMSDTAGDIVGVLLHVGLDEELHVGVFVLVHLQEVLGGTRPVGVAIDDLVHLGRPVLHDVGLGGGLHVGVPVLVPLQVVLVIGEVLTRYPEDGVLVQRDLVCAGLDSWGCALVETDRSRAIVIVRLCAVLTGEAP